MRHLPSRTSKWVYLVGIIICTSWLVLTANAASIHFDDITIQGGDLFYDGEGGALIGSNVIFDTVNGDATPIDPGDLTCETCLLDFETGTNITEPGTSYQWNGGGSFMLTGTVKDGATVIATGVLLSGTWLTPVEGFKIGTTRILIRGSGLDQKNQDLLAAFGIASGDFEFSTTEISAPTAFAANDGFTSTVDNADLINLSFNFEPLPVPEPSPLLLLGLGLLGLIVWRRFAPLSQK